MLKRTPVPFLLIPLLLVSGYAKDKKKQSLPNYVLHARTVFVVVHPDATEPLTNPTANRDARYAVETAMEKWGRFEVVQNASAADLIIAVRKGGGSGPVITRSPMDRTIGGASIDPPSIDPQRRSGNSPNVTDVDPPPPTAVPIDRRSPRIEHQTGSSEDTFEVYRGGSDYPLDASPIWRYIAKDGLNSPRLAAVDQFRNAIEESEKQSEQKH